MLNNKTMKKILKNSLLFIVFGLLAGCAEFLEPTLDGSLTEEEVFTNAAYFNGLLGEVQNTLPNLHDYMMDCATDNAVTNNYNHNYLKMATGGLRPNFNPLNDWVSNFRQIRRINIFLSKMVLDYSKPWLTPVRFVRLGTPSDSLDNINTFFRLKGEAFFFRAYFQADQLKKFGGEAVNGEYLGFPIVTTVLKVGEDELDLPRNTYQECVGQILADCDSALKYLPVEYKGGNPVLGATMNGRANGIAAMALKARVLLFAASPAFNPGNDIEKWEQAAIAAGDAIVAIGGLQDLASPLDYYFNKLNNRSYDIRDIFLRGNVRTGNRAYENDNYPPSMYGNGLLNPSQNFVDAFPDKNGYPISESTLYNPADPYANRDPRLEQFVAVNNSFLGPNDYHKLETFEGGVDAFNPAYKTSRTSYYMKKMLKTANIQLIPGQLTGTARVATHLGAPELYLNYAEAASEAWGPKGDPQGYGFNAQQVIQRIHKRYGSSNAYLNNVAVNSPDVFRQLVRNERRLELSFEGHYFWDQRRWIAGDDLSSLNEPVKGARIVKDSSGNFTYDLNVVLEQRRYTSKFMPIPYDELFNSPALIQNKGWE